jgi:hypothetical protein
MPHVGIMERRQRIDDDEGAALGCRPLGGGRGVFIHERPQSLGVLLTLLDLAFEPVEEPTISERPDAKRGRADIGKRAVALDF